MENANVSMFCSVCQTKLKRQVLGSNVFYYCKNCGCVSSEAYLSGEINVLNSQKPTVVKREPLLLSFTKVH
ncbi:MAG TPA: hypothetical protein VGK06_12380 [Methanosarcina sp.]